MIWKGSAGDISHKNQSTLEDFSGAAAAYEQTLEAEIKLKRPLQLMASIHQ